ncbi:tetratricopeptide repeat domain-containing protein [Trichoderma ceciliae]
MATEMSFATSGRLDVLRDPVDTTQNGVDTVLIPGIGTAPPESWPFVEQEWLANLPNSGAGARILTYEYASPFAGAKPSWESILMLGYDLLQHLLDEQSQSSPNLATTKPMVIVCHSLGGVIVKQASCVANKQFPRYGSIVNAIAAVTFLSTPHRYGDKATSLTRFRDVLEATTGKSLKISSANVEQEGAILLDLADRFEGISFRTPILSVYELSESKNSSTPLRPKYQQLVNREACTTHAPMETVIGLNFNHHDTCIFTKSVGGEGISEVNKFMYETLRDATQLVAIRLEDQEYQYATMSSYSPTISELSLKLEQLELTECPSNNATEWPSNRATEGTSLSGFELVYPTTPNSEVRKTLHLPCFLLNTHSSNADFCGREDVLERLATELLPSKNKVTASSTALRQFALCGFGGIGKTETAREFARRHKESFDAVFWVVADEIAKLDNHFQQISLALGLETSSECKSQVVSREIVKGWLSNSRKHLSGPDEFVHPGQARSEADWLLIFDNADDPMILADYWSQGSGSILITSRDPLAKSIFTRRPLGLDLGPLSQKDSLSLFSHLTTVSNELEGDAARKIADALGGVPLAISQMAGIIRRQDLTLSEFLELYADHEEHASLYETKFDTNLVTSKLLELISFLDPDNIGEDLLMTASTELLSEGAQFKKSNYIEARSDLLQSSLIYRDKEKQQISVHRLVQDAILTTMDMAEKQLMFDQVVRILWAGWPSAMPKPSREPELPQPKSTGGRLHVARWPICASIYPHVIRIHQFWSTISDMSEATSLLFAKLLSEAAWYQKERGRTRQFDGFFETARCICESSKHVDRDALLADIHFCVGAIAMDASDFDASRIHKECSLDLLGISRIQDRRYEEGEADLKEALRIRKALGNYIPRSGEANLSWSLLAQGKLEECNTLLLDSLTGREKALGKDDRESANQWDESFEYHQRAWRHMLATVGDRDFYTANVAHKIAEHLNRLGRNGEAITMINEALDIWSVDPSAHKNEVARTTFLKGKLFEAMGKTQKASIALRVACRLRKEITKEDRDAKSLTTKDFDEIVAFWAR